MFRFGLAAVWVFALVTAAHAQGKLSFTPSKIDGTHANVQISWNGIANPSTDDYIAVYSHEHPSRAWLKVQNKLASPDGSFSIKLLNWRQSYQFRYVAANGDVVAQSATLPVDGRVPTQIHIAKASQGSMRVMWVSNDNGTAPVVQYGFTQANLSMTSTGSSATYTIDDMCEERAKKWFLDPGFIHSVVLENLSYDTTYFYRVGNQKDGWSAVKKFRSGPIEGNKKTHVVAFGDAGTASCQGFAGWCEPDAGNTYKNIEKDLEDSKDLSLLLHIGDVSYAVGYAHRWEEYFHDVEPIASQIPYMVCIGNHEYDYTNQPFKPWWSNYGTDSGGECGVPYWHRFHMPANTKSLWYSFNHGNIHFVFMSSEHDFTVGSPQYKFLVEDLASVDHATTPWIIFSGHRPMYSSEHYKANFTYIDAIRETYEPVLVKYQVDLALWGHVHCYERTCPVIGSKCVEKGPIHLTIGMGGMEKARPEWTVPQPKWSIVRDKVSFGYTRITTNGNELKLQYVVNDGRKVHDEIHLKK